MAIECELLTEKLACYDLEAEQIDLGRTYRQALTSSERNLSAADPLKIERHLYRPPGQGSQSNCRLGLRAGTIICCWMPRPAFKWLLQWHNLPLATVRACLLNWAGSGCPMSCLPIGKSTVTE